MRAGSEEAKGMRDAVVEEMRAGGQRSHMRMGTVPVSLGRVKGISRQRGSAVGQSASVAQKAEQLPMVAVLVAPKH